MTKIRCNNCNEVVEATFISKEVDYYSVHNNYECNKCNNEIREDINIHKEEK